MSASGAIIVLRGYSETKHSFGGRTVRVPVAEERMVLAFVKSHDTELRLTQVPCHCHLNGVGYEVRWSDNPPPNEPESLFENYWKDNDGRCVRCDKREGDHLSAYHRTPKSCVFTEKIDRSELLRPFR